MSADESIEVRLKKLRLFGLLARIEDVRHEAWLHEMIALEEDEKVRRGLAHRMKVAGLGAFKPIADFDWKWPKKVDRLHVEELLSLQFLAEGANVVILGPNGVGKTMLLKNIAHRALHEGHGVVVKTASDLLADLAKQESTAARTRRLAVYSMPSLLCIDEVGYLSYDVRHADLLFEVISRRYDKKRSILLTTNKPFAEWSTTFPNAACVVTLVDRLLHRAEVISIDGESYRLHEAQERQKQKAANRKRTKQTTD